MRFKTLPENSPEHETSAAANHVSRPLKRSEMENASRVPPITQQNVPKRRKISIHRVLEHSQVI